MNFTYVLDDDHRPVPEPDPVRWEQWFAEHTNRVARTSLGDVIVSTIFLGVDALGNGRLFETVILTGDSVLDYQTRCATWEEALAMHEAGIRYVKCREQ